MSTATASVTTIAEIMNRYSPYLTECRAAIDRDFGRAPLGGLLTKYFQGGKMFRPLLVFVSTSAVGGEPPQVIPAAQALELLHGASLIHDDIIDQAKERRGRSALHVQIGAGRAVVLGDYLILRSYTVFARSSSPRVVEALRVLSTCAEECCRGQIAELTSENDEGREPISEEDYLSIVRGKTASQFVAAAAVGGILGNGSAEQINALRTFALNVGVGFQIRDDELDVAAEEFAGKHGLFKGNLPTLPIIYLWKYGSSTAKKHYRELVMNGGAQLELKEILRAEGILDRLRTVKALYLNQALEALQCFRGSSELSALTAIAYHAIFRDA